jgi:hypothetical protein
MAMITNSYNHGHQVNHIKIIIKQRASRRRRDKIPENQTSGRKATKIRFNPPNPQNPGPHPPKIGGAEHVSSSKNQKSPISFGNQKSSNRKSEIIKFGNIANLLRCKRLRCG